MSNEQKQLFRRILDGLVAGRSRQAQRIIDSYVESHRDERPHRG